MQVVQAAKQMIKTINHQILQFEIRRGNDGGIFTFRKQFFSFHPNTENRERLCDYNIQ
jgi:hypothetical protein